MTKKKKKKIKKKKTKFKQIKRSSKKKSKQFLVKKKKKNINLTKYLKLNLDYIFNKIIIKTKIILEKISIKLVLIRLKKIEKLRVQESKFQKKKKKEVLNRREILLREIKKEERSKIVEQRDHLWKVGDRFKLIRDKYKAYKQKLRNEQLEELEVRKKSREEAREILEQQKAENEIKKKVEERLDRYSRNMKSIVFQINKRYLARKRSPLRFVDNISENGECFIKNADAPTDKDYLILLFINGETPIDRLSNPISIEDKTDLGNVKKFLPKDIFDASDFIIERLATMFDNERKLQKSL